MNTRTAARATPLFLLCLGALWLLHGVIGRRLPFPDFSGPALVDWFATADPADVVMTAFRAVAIGMAWYLAVVVGLQLLAGLLGWRPLLLDAITPALVKQLLGASLTISLSVPAFVSSASAAESPPVTMVRIDDDSPADTPAPVFSPERSRQPTSAEPDTMVMTRLGPTDAPTAPAATSWSVTEGEHFWQIATEVLEERSGTAPSESDVDAYWRRLIERNQHRLVDPGNPDLLLPGQVLDLPD